MKPTLSVTWAVLDRSSLNFLYTDFMPCLIPIIAVFFPRVVMLVIAIFTHWFGAAFNSVLWPLLGFMFMPYTTLAYMAAMLNNNHSLNGGWLVLVIVAVVVDLGGQGGSARRKRRVGR